MDQYKILWSQPSPRGGSYKRSKCKFLWGQLKAAEEMRRCFQVATIKHIRFGNIVKFYIFNNDDHLKSNAIKNLIII